MNKDRPIVLRPEKAHCEEFVSKVLIGKNIPFFYTGSVEFGEAGQGSDTDIAIPICYRGVVLGSLAALWGEERAKESEYNNGVKIPVFRAVDRDIVANLIFLHPVDYVVWAVAGEIYKRLPHQADKWRRHGLFELLRGVVKVSLTGTEAPAVITSKDCVATATAFVRGFTDHQ